EVDPVDGARHPRGDLDSLEGLNRADGRDRVLDGSGFDRRDLDGELDRSAAAAAGFAGAAARARRLRLLRTGSRGEEQRTDDDRSGGARPIPAHGTAVPLLSPPGRAPGRETASPAGGGDAAGQRPSARESDSCAVPSAKRWRARLASASNAETVASACSSAVARPSEWRP